MKGSYLSFIMTLALLLLTACSSSEGKTITQTSGKDGVTTVIEEKNGRVTTVFEPRQEGGNAAAGSNAAASGTQTANVQNDDDLYTSITGSTDEGQELLCEEAGIRTRIPDYCSWYWSEKDQGLYIYVGLEDRDTAIPYIFIVRHRNTKETPEEYLSDTTPYMEQTYGEKLVYSGDLEYRQYGPLNLASKTFRYRNETGIVENIRLLQKYGKDLINYSVKYWEGEDDLTMEAYEMIIDHFRITDGEEAETIVTAAAGTKNTTGVSAAAGEQEIRIEPAETKSIVWGTFNEPNGDFSMDVPAGWAVRIGLPDYHYAVDLISYGITVFDPDCPECMLYFNLNTSGLLKSETARQWYARNYGSDSMFALRPVVSPPTAEAFFKVMGAYYGYSDFRMQQHMGKTALGSELLEGSALSRNGVRTTGLYSAALVNTISQNVQIDPFNAGKGYVDAGLYTAYNVVVETAPAEEFINYQPVLDRCLGSIKFTSRFITDRNEVWRQIIGTSQQIMNNADEISSMIMDTWEKSGRSYDIISQRQSDATMGFDRVFDTQTGEYLRAESGFSDWYKGSRYEAADNDQAYLNPYAGTIYWK